MASDHGVGGSTPFRRAGRLAQLVEQFPLKESVQGSSPWSLTFLIRLDFYKFSYGKQLDVFEIFCLLYIRTLSTMKKVLLLLFFVFGFFLFPSDGFAQVPPAVSGVLVEYPEVATDGTASFVQASCKWDAVAGATSYNYTVTEVETNTQIQTATVDTGTQKVAFPITQERTYKCDVFATNASGSGPIGTHSLLCSAEGLLEPTPTTPAVPPTSLPTKPPIESPGAFANTAIILGGVALVIIGGLALILL